MLIGQRGGNVARGQEVRGKRYKGRRDQMFASGFVMICQTGGFGITVNNQNQIKLCLHVHRSQSLFSSYYSSATKYASDYHSHAGLNS